MIDEDYVQKDREEYSNYFFAAWITLGREKISMTFADKS